MINGKQIIPRCIAILMLFGIIFGIVFFEGYGLYKSVRDIDRPVHRVTKVDSIGRPFEIDGRKFYLRNDTLFEENDNMYADMSIDTPSVGEKTHDPSLLKDVIIEAFGGTNEKIEDYSVFGCGKADIQRLYMMSILNSVGSGRTIEVSRWVTSGDWRYDNYEMTVTIP